MRNGSEFADYAQGHKPSGLLSGNKNTRVENPYTGLIGEDYRNAMEDLDNEGNRKRTLSDEELGVNSKRKLSEDLAEENKGDRNYARVKDSIGQIYKLMGVLTSKLDERDASTDEESKILFSKVEMIQTNLGTRATGRTDRFEIPTIWGSVAVLSGTLDDMHRKMEALPSTAAQKETLRVEFNRLEVKALKTVDMIILGVEGRVKHSAQEVERNAKHTHHEFKRVDERIEKTICETDGVLLHLAQGASLLKTNIEKLERQYNMLSQMRTTMTGNHSSNNNCSNYVQEMDAAMEDTRLRIVKLMADSSGETLKSFGLGFQSRLDSDAWVDQYLCDVPYGLVVDAHMVFEHLFSFASGNEQGSLKTWYNIQKLDLANMTQATCLTSFDGSVPKYLSKSSNMAIPSRTKGLSCIVLFTVTVSADSKLP